MRYAHTNIAAKDWKKISQFYIDVFGCMVKPPERRLSGEWLDKATGLSDAQLEGVHLLLPGHGKNGPTLEIFTYAEMHDAAPIMANHQGFTHIAFEVESVGETYEKALNHGAEKLGEIVEKNVPGVGVLQFVYFRDPEGNIVEIQSWR
jgi:catechol 2,3-dioxygenase-like lactoylglutathione lyase family enzyme